MKRARFVLVAAWVLAMSAPAWAHQRSVSYSEWRDVAGGVEVRVSLSQLDLSVLRASVGRADVAAQVAKAFALARGGEPCTVARAASAQPAPPGRARFAFQLRCPEGGDYALRTELLFDLVPAHAHFARVALGELQGEWMLGPDHRSVEAQDRPRSGVAWVLQGVRHVLLGWDHLLFLLVLLLTLGRGPQRSLLWCITGFTLGHSVTLAGRALGWMTPDARGIEVLIALSIVLIAAEGLWLASPRRRRVPLLLAGAIASAALLSPLSPLLFAGAGLFCLCWMLLLRERDESNRARWVLAALFGLVHGFGFAGALAELGLPTGGALWALGGFNLGVELGQLWCVAIAWPLLRRPLLWRPVSLAVARSAALAAGTAAFVWRLM